jgi:hypothetical protein
MRTKCNARPEPFSDLIYEEQIRLAERELSSCIATVKASYGLEQATLSAQDWLDESELMDSPPRSETRNWRAATIAASAKLANRLQSRAESTLSTLTTDTKVSPTPSVNCFSSILLAQSKLCADST